MGAIINKSLQDDDIEGYHILNICEGSPAQVVGLEAYFDFIVTICGVHLDGCPNVLLNLLHQSAGKPIIMNVYSFRNHKFREVKVTPNLEWGIQGLLGVTIRFCTVKEAYNNVYHILEVQPNSPADVAGLRAFSDYIIGAEVHTECNDVNLPQLICEYDRRELKLFLYNRDDDACRSVVITPDSKWGGEGVIGCGIGNGYLHRIPTQAHNDAVSSNDCTATTSKICNTIIDSALSIEAEHKPLSLLYVPPFIKSLGQAETEIDLEANLAEQSNSSCEKKNNSCIETADVEYRIGNETQYLMMMP